MSKPAPIKTTDLTVSRTIPATPAEIYDVWEGTRGLETVVTIALEAKGSATHMTIHHAGVPDDDMGRQHAEGWGFMLEMLEKKLAK